MSDLTPLVDVDTTRLADWLEAQGEATWWNVDGDVELTESLRLPCPADELAAALRGLPQRRVRLLGDPSKRSTVVDGPGVFDALAHDEGGVRVLYLTWDDPAAVWVLAEDVGVKQALGTATA